MSDMHHHNQPLVEMQSCKLFTWDGHPTRILLIFVSQVASVRKNAADKENSQANLISKGRV
jgi:hypothetical protein